VPRAEIVIAAALGAVALGTAWVSDMPGVAGTLLAAVDGLGPWTYALAPFLAGAAGVPARRAAAYSVLGAGAWCSALIVAGYAFAASLDSHLDVVGNVALGAAGAILLAGALRRRAVVAPVC
jgi:hypothetical protein